MEITIAVHGHAKEFIPGGRDKLVVEAAKPLTVRQLLNDVGIKPEIFAGVFVNGERRDLDFELTEDSEVILMSPTAGG